MLIVATLLTTLLAAPAAAGGRERYRFAPQEAALAGADALPAWRDMRARERSESQTIRACLADAGACPRHLKGYRVVIERARVLTPRRQLAVVNRFINKRRRVDDRRSSGGAWAGLGTLLRDGGDCEDFAVAKYLMLRELGFPATDLRVVVAYDRKARDLHALVAASVDGEPLLLELDDTILRRNQHGQFVFLFSVNEDGLWDHGKLDAVPYLRRYLQGDTT